MTDWRPIDSAPFTKDELGDRWLDWCLLWIPDKHGGLAIVGGMDAEMWLCRDADRACSDILTEPTHWAPIDPPEAALDGDPGSEG